MTLKLIVLCLSAATISAAYDWNDYYSLEDTDKFLTGLLSFPDNLSVSNYYSIGKTANRRDIKAFQIIYKEDEWTAFKPRILKPSIFIEAGIYGNEWIAPAVATYIINRLVKLSVNELQTHILAREFRWYIVPIVNPDGYEYSFTTDPLWRKNRKQYSLFCRGVDLNRNFGFHWNEDGSSRDPCSDCYAGPKARSENETRAVMKYFDRLPRLKGYISLQGYGAKVLYPYGFSGTEHAEKEFELERLTRVTAEKISKNYGTKYGSGNMFNALHQVSGNGMDFAMSKGLKQTFTFKLPPTPDSPQAPSRRVPTSEIFRTAVEGFNAIMSMARDIHDNVEIKNY